MFKYFWLFVPPTLFVVMMLVLAFELHKQEGRTVRYDCRISEISPDFPPEVREACRKLRAQSGRI